jgi:hypothetical protein
MARVLLEAIGDTNRYMKLLALKGSDVVTVHERSVKSWV